MRKGHLREQAGADWTLSQPAMPGAAYRRCQYVSPSELE
jgi:hypothetical protein